MPIASSIRARSMQLITCIAIVQTKQLYPLIHRGVITHCHTLGVGSMMYGLRLGKTDTTQWYPSRLCTALAIGLLVAFLIQSKAP